MKLLIYIIITTFAISMTVSGPAYSQGCAPEHPYFGLYTDETHPSSCVEEVIAYSVEMWGCALPSTVGIMCIEFAIAYPLDYDIIPSTVTLHPNLVAVLGDLESGLSACYSACQMDWNWVFHQNIWVFPDASPAWVEIIPHPDNQLDLVMVVTCEDGY